jgi:hypothetical protein
MKGQTVDRKTFTHAERICQKQDSSPRPAAREPKQVRASPSSRDHEHWTALGYISGAVRGYMQLEA